MFIVASVGSPLYWDFSGGASGKEPACQCGDLRDAGSKKKKETRVQSLGQEDPLEKEMATHSTILAWENPRDRGA